MSASKISAVQKRLKEGGYDSGTIVLVLSHLSSYEQEREIFGETKQAPLCNSGRARLWREAIDDLLGERLRQVKAIKQEIRETQEKANVLVSCVKLATFDEKFKSKLEALKSKAFGILEDVGDFIRRERASQPVTYISVDGGITKMHKPWGKPDIYKQLERQSQHRCLW